MALTRERITVVTQTTRLQGLLQRWSTRGAAQFNLANVRLHQAEKQSANTAAHEAQAAVAEFAQYEHEDRNYRKVLDRLRRELDLGYPLEFIDRSFLPNYDFGRCLLVVVVGQDGLVANTAKYVGELPIVAVNPDPAQHDGVLLPFSVDQARRAALRGIRGQAQTRNITLAEACLNDGQRMLAFNDFFIGVQGHTSARYVLTAGNQAESQSSSGVIVSTGAGSTGWFSSVFNMVEGIATWTGGETRTRIQLNWEDRRLIWAVREPFKSKHSDCQVVAGELVEDEELILESLMPQRGLIFSDGIETDYMEFNSGTIVRIHCATQSAHLVVS